MKVIIKSKISVWLILLVCSLSAKAQLILDSDKNYIVTYSPNQALTEIGSSTPFSASCPVVQYCNGLGDPTQSVSVGYSPLGADLVTHIEYDDRGRAYKTWLPFAASNNNGDYIAAGEIANKSALFYSSSNGIPSDENRYSIKKYDFSPLNRILKEYGPGANWQNTNKGVELYMYGNNQTDSLVVNKYMLLSSNNFYFKKTGTYSNNTLFVTCVIDEDGHKIWTFKDNLGKTILTRTYNGTYNNTYYIYNNLNQLKYVLPPLAADQLTADNVTWSILTATMSQYGYYYLYDSRGNCIEKKLPGLQMQYLVYDKANRLVLSQDGNQRVLSGNIWSFIRYDVFGRPIIKGEISLPSGANSSYLVNLCNDYLFVESFNSNTSNYGYTNNCASYGGIVTALNEILYYDNYSFINNSWIPGTRTSTLAWNNSSPLDERFINTSNDALLSAKGLLTGKISFLSNNQNSKKYTAFYYDQKGRIVQKNGTSHFNPASADSYGIDSYAYTYDFNGNILHERHQHRGTNTSYTYIMGTKNTYDHAGRLMTSKDYLMNESAAVTTLTNLYNELGQLYQKTYGNNLETQTYSYNIRGWLKEVQGTMYANKLYYERNSADGLGCYNGNICEANWMRLSGKIDTMNWKNNTNLWQENWMPIHYQYDNLNRLVQSHDENNYITESLTYDKQGNITNLSRNGIRQVYWSNGKIPFHSMGAIDNLTYTYNGNQLVQVSDAVNGPYFTGTQDFKDNSTDNYLYDYNGNLKSNFDKKITSIQYNYLNLPETIQMRNGHMATFAYDASGAKTFATHITATGSETLMPIGSTLLNNTLGYTIASTQNTIYLDNVIYENNSLDQVMTDYGKFKRTNPVTDTYPTLQRQYFLKDYLGNVRVIFDENGIIKQANNYMSFGMEVGESSNNQNMMTYQNVQYGGKEFDRKFELNTYDFGARNYDATIGRWTTMDPLCELFYSISPYVYSVNNPIKYSDLNGLWPTNKVVDNGWKGNRGFSASPVWNEYHKLNRPHYGQDFPAAVGNNVHALAKGVVSVVGWDPDGWGNFVKIDHGGGYQTLYAHLKTGGIKVKVGDPISTNGGILALSGNTGGAHGAHLHLEILLNGKHIDPISISDLQELLSEMEISTNKENPIELKEVSVTAKSKYSEQLMQKCIEDLKWLEISPNKHGNTGRYNKPGRSSDQYYSDEFLKQYNK